MEKIISPYGKLFYLLIEMKKENEINEIEKKFLKGLNLNFLKILFLKND